MAEILTDERDTAEYVEGKPEGLTPLEAAVEAIVFSSVEPLSSSRICEAYDGATPKMVDRAVSSLNVIYESQGHALRIRKIAGGFQYYITPRETEYVNKLFRRERKLRLTKPALETVAIIAYKQPLSKSELEQIRGVACDGVLQTLMERDLVRISGRSEAIGRPLLYSATEEFLKFFGINSFDDLPKLAEIEEILANMEAERAARQADRAPLRDDSADEIVRVAEFSEHDRTADTTESSNFADPTESKQS